MDFDESYYEEFVTESKEHLETIEDDLLELEKHAEEVGLDSVNNIFRAIHTIKGASGFFGLKNIEDLTHLMENLISQIRDKGKMPTPEMIDVLLEGIDKVSHLLDDIFSSNDEDIRVLLQELEKQTQEEKRNEKSLEENTDVEEYNWKDELGLTAEELKSHAKPGMFLYAIRFVNAHTETLRENLATLGDILQISKLEMDQKDEGDISSIVLFRSILEEDFIPEACKVDKENVFALRRFIPSQLQNESQNKAGVKPNQKKVPKAKNKSDDADHSKNQTIRIHVELLNQLMRQAGELVLIRNQQLMSIENSIAIDKNMANKLNHITSEIQESIMKTRLQPIGNIFGKFPRVVRDLSKKLNKKIELFTAGNDVELDKTILENLTDPLTHLIRNSCDHGIEIPEVRKENGKAEEASIFLRAYHESGQVNIKIIDDGAGINTEFIAQKALERNYKTEQELSQMSDKDIINLITMPGFSTAQKVTQVSGRGVGMDVVKTSIENLGGSLEITSKINEGTTIHLRLPLTMAIIPSLIIKAEDRRYAIPQVNLEELVCLYDDDILNSIEYAGYQEVYQLRNELLPIVRMNEVLNNSEVFTECVQADISERYMHNSQNLKTLSIAILRVGEFKFGLVVDGVIGTEEIVVKSMHSSVKHLKIFSGATILGDGDVALIIDVEGIYKHANVHIHAGKIKNQNLKVVKKDIDGKAFLMFKYGVKETFSLPLTDVAHVAQIETKDIDYVGADRYINLKDKVFSLLYLEDFMKIGAIKQTKDAFLIIPKNNPHDIAFVVSEVLDVFYLNENMDDNKVSKLGVLGSFLYHEKLAMCLDVEIMKQTFNHANECKEVE